MTPTPSPSLDALVAASAQPWWGIPVIAGCFLLLGGALGAVISFLSTRASDRRKAAREDEQRWDSELLARAGTMLSTLDILYETNLHIQDSINDSITNGSSPESLQLAAANMEKQTAAVNNFARARTELGLIAPFDVLTAANVISKDFRLVQAKPELRTSPPVAPEGGAVPDFINKVRSATGVPGFSNRKQL